MGLHNRERRRSPASDRIPSLRSELGGVTLEVERYKYISYRMEGGRRKNETKFGEKGGGRKQGLNGGLNSSPPLVGKERRRQEVFLLSPLFLF